MLIPETFTVESKSALFVSLLSKVATSEAPGTVVVAGPPETSDQLEVLLNEPPFGPIQYLVAA